MPDTLQRFVPRPGQPPAQQAGDALRRGRAAAARQAQRGHVQARQAGWWALFAEDDAEQLHDAVCARGHGPLVRQRALLPGPGAGPVVDKLLGRHHGLRLRHQPAHAPGHLRDFARGCALRVVLDQHAEQLGAKTARLRTRAGWQVAQGSGLPGSMSTWSAIGFIAVFSSAPAHTLWVRSVATTGANRARAFNHLMPLFAAVPAIGLLGEQQAPWHLGGALPVLCGVVLATRP